MKKLKHSIMFLLAVFCMCIALTESSTVFAATSYTITFTAWDGSSISTQSVADGSTIGTMPSDSNVLLWIDQMGNTITADTVPTADMVVRAVKTTDISATGTLDSGNIVWFIADGKLFVTGSGTLGSIPVYNSTNSTKIYGLSLGNVEVSYPSIMYDWLVSSSVNDEQSGGYGQFSAPANPTQTWALNISRPIRFAGQTISYPHSTVGDYAPWSPYASEITEITIAEKVSLAGNFSLYFNLASTSVSPSSINESIYSNLKNIYLYGDTSGITQMSGMFARIPNLEGIYVKEGSSFDASSCVDANAMFYGNEKLTNTSITLADGTVLKSIINTFTNTSNIKDMRYMFFDCESIVKPAISAWDVSNVTDMSYMFTGCNNAQLTIGANDSASDLKNWDMSSVYSTTGMFAGSDIDITSSDPLANLWGQTSSQVLVGAVNLDCWNLNSLQSSVFMFAQNHAITGITWTSSAPVLLDASAMIAFNDGLSTVIFDGLDTPTLAYADTMLFCSGTDGSTFHGTGWVMDSLEEARLMFYNTGFSEIVLNDTNPSNLKIASGLFFSNDNLVSLGDQHLKNWTLSNLQDASYMFYGDSSLQELNCSNWDMSSATDISYMLGNCASLQTANLSSWAVSSKLKNMDCFMLGCKNISTIDLSSFDLSGVERAFQAFSGMSALTSIDLSGIELSSLQIANGMFANDYVLASIDFGTCTAPVLEDASGMFYSCALLDNISIQNLIGKSTTNISYILSGCVSLNKLDISSWDTSGVIYMQCAFDGMEQLENILVGNNFSTISAKSCAAMLRNCGKLDNASLQSFLSKFNPAVMESTFEMFKGCSNLQTLDLSSVDCSAIRNYSGMFYGDSSLKKIVISDTFMVNATSDGDDHVFYCLDDTLTNLTIKTTGSTLPKAIKNYDWINDNRIFLKETGYSINGTSGNTFSFSIDSADTATLRYDAESTILLNDVPLSVSYSWKSGEMALRAATNEYSVSRGSTGSFTAVAVLADLANTDSLSKIFNISQTSGVGGISAEYIGESIYVGKDFSLSDVKVQLATANGNTISLAEGDFTVSGQTVTACGSNLFTAYYTDANNVLWSAEFTVPGYIAIGSITASYTGPNITVGNTYDKGNVSVIAYYEDDTSKTHGFSVEPTSFSSDLVTVAGNNIFNVYYIDSGNNNKRLSAQFTVTGVANPQIVSIQATYNGADIVVGQSYLKENVSVIATYGDGTQKSVSDFTVDNTVVKKTGVNTYTASVLDSTGSIFTDTFNVTGISSENETSGISSISAIYTGGSVKVGNDIDKEDVTVTIYYTNGKSATTTNFSLSGTRVSVAGDNSFTAVVTDTDGKKYSANFTVQGWMLENVDYIDAVYNGPTILIGNNYDKSNVVVTIHFTDGTADMITDDFTVNSTVVTSEGTNTFTAYVVDSNGSTFSDDFLVRGTSNVAEANRSVASETGVKTGDSSLIVGLIICLSGLFIILMVLLYLRFGSGHNDELSE